MEEWQKALSFLSSVREIEKIKYESRNHHDHLLPKDGTLSIYFTFWYVWWNGCLNTKWICGPFHDPLTHGHGDGGAGDIITWPIRKNNMSFHYIFCIFRKHYVELVNIINESFLMNSWSMSHGKGFCCRLVNHDFWYRCNVLQCNTWLKCNTM